MIFLAELFSIWLTLPCFVPSKRIKFAPLLMALSLSWLILVSVVAIQGGESG